MLSYLADFEQYWGPLRLFRYITFRALFGSATALVLAFMVAGPLLRRLRKFKLHQALRDKSEVGSLADLHAGKKGTPTMGGLMIYISVTGSTLLWAEPNVFVLTALAVYSGLTLLGFLDDYTKITRRHSGGLNKKQKIIWQTLITVLALVILLWHPDSTEKMREFWVPFLKNPVFLALPVPLLFVLLFFILVGSSNAINLTDGIDGLAIGCTISVALVYAIMSYAAGNAIIAEYLFISFVPGVGELSIICGCLVGAGLAFLWYNSHPAEVFMGDTGSLALGGLIGAVAFMVHQPLTLVIVGGIFVMEALSVILQVFSFKTRKKRIFKMAPIHHHFELKGWPESKVVIRFWILSLAFALAGLGTLKLR
ncbi:MAG: phospho-N-acetylmuramoyl-pentapeptide-transferase [Verrucomicrobiae bacterium]|nr:phospho-N-acetylmuramoyl-pentapeptide-transferase [Verrucomicrobiae bacterium]